MDVLNKRHGDLPAGAVYIGRPTKWGNPYTHLTGGTLAQHQVGSREEAVEAYRHWLERTVDVDPTYFDELLDATALVCWCAPASCHGHIIAEWLDQRRDMLGRWEEMISEQA